MTPARKSALQWFYDRGAVPDLMLFDAPSDRMTTLMHRSGQIKHTPEGWTLTDKGRRDLHEAGR